MSLNSIFFYYLKNFSNYIPYKNFNINLINNVEHSFNEINYIEQFFVGLLEGDGTITVDYINDYKKRVRIVIALKNLSSNHFMLYLIVKYIGGRVVVERNNRYVTWYATNKSDIAKVFVILSKYPLLTTSKICQLDFAKNFINSNNFMTKDEFIKFRNTKYNNQKNLLDFQDLNFVIPFYFPAWLSGLIEAEGHFKLIKYATGKIKVSQFVIGQNEERFLFKAILLYFNKINNKISVTNSVENKNLKHYKIHLSGKDFRDHLSIHFKNYPLLGDKKDKYLEWFNNHI